jgi:hypothetical protein
MQVLPTPINMRGRGRLSIIQLIKLIYLYVSYLLLSPNPNFSNLICCYSFVSATSEGVLGGLADPRATLRALALTGSLPSLRSRSTAGISRRPV